MGWINFFGGEKITGTLAIKYANSIKAEMPKNSHFDSYVLDHQKHKDIKFPVWTGTLITYEKIGKKIGEKIEYLDSGTRIRYIIDSSLIKNEVGLGMIINQGFDEKDIPYFEFLEIEKSRVVEIRINKNAPIEIVQIPDGGINEYYKFDYVSGMIRPFKTSKDDPDGRRFYRVRLSYIGLIKRDNGDALGTKAKNINAFEPFSSLAYAYGVVLGENELRKLLEKC
ncbi:MAG: hypothetical protein QW833_00145 [Candidatus Anstonellaceae archaeon]